MFSLIANDEGSFKLTAASAPEAPFTLTPPTLPATRQGSAANTVQFSVVAAPTDAGDVTSTIALTTDIPNGDAARRSTSTRSVLPAGVNGPPQVDLGGNPINQTSVGQHVEISNCTDAPVTITTVVLTRHGRWSSSRSSISPIVRRSTPVGSAKWLVVLQAHTEGVKAASFDATTDSGAHHVGAADRRRARRRCAVAIPARPMAARSATTPAARATRARCGRLASRSAAAAPSSPPLAGTELTIGAYRSSTRSARAAWVPCSSASTRCSRRRAAIKVLLPSFSADQAIVRRFFNEARAVTRIADPGIVQVFDFGIHTDGSAFIVMELLEGETMARRQRRIRRFDCRDALRLIRMTCTSLAAAHAKGVVHRDLKPDNIFIVGDPAVTGGERPKIRGADHRRSESVVRADPDRSLVERQRKDAHSRAAAS